MTELPPQLRQVRDFFFKHALALSPERTYLHHPELIKNQTIFRLEDLRKHLNNPFLDLDFVQIIDRGQLVDLRAARCFKVVQRRQIEFVNRIALQKHLENGDCTDASLPGGLTWSNWGNRKWGRSMPSL